MGFRYQHQRPILEGAPIREIGLELLDLWWGECSTLLPIGGIGVPLQYFRPRPLARILGIPPEQHGVDQSTAVADLTLPGRRGELDGGVRHVERFILAGVPHEELIQIPAGIDLRYARPRRLRRYGDAEVAAELSDLRRNAVELRCDRLLVLEDPLQLAAHDLLVVDDRVEHLPLRALPQAEQGAHDQRRSAFASARRELDEPSQRVRGHVPDVVG